MIFYFLLSSLTLWIRATRAYPVGRNLFDEVVRCFIHPGTMSFLFLSLKITFLLQCCENIGLFPTRQRTEPHSLWFDKLPGFVSLWTLAPPGPQDYSKSHELVPSSFSHKLKFPFILFHATQ